MDSTEVHHETDEDNEEAGSGEGVERPHGAAEKVGGRKTRETDCGGTGEE